MASIGVIFTSKYHKAAKFMTKIPASCVVNNSRLSACHGEMEPFEDYLSTRGHLTSIRNKPQQKILGNFQHQCLTEMVVNACSCHMVAKSVYCCCVWKVAFSNSVTFYDMYVELKKSSADQFECLTLSYYFVVLYPHTLHLCINAWYFD